MEKKEFDDSSIFDDQEIIDPKLDWISLTNNSYSYSGAYYTDITSSDYYSDGKTLNVLLWINNPVPFFKPEILAKNEEIHYGMYIDSDFNDLTGYGGVDYNYELGWNNKSKEWTIVLNKWSHEGYQIVLDNKTVSYNNFSKKDAKYIQMSLELSKILSPKKYKVTFYAEVKRKGIIITDFTRTVAIPPLEINVTSTSNSIELRKGDQKTIEIQIRSTQGYEPTVNIDTKSQTNFIKSSFGHNYQLSNRSDYTLRIPSYGIATIPLTITSLDDAPTGQQTLFIFVNSSFPSEQFLKPKSYQKLINNDATLVPSSVESENIFTQSSLIVTLQDPLTLIDKINDIWNKIGGALSFIMGILIGQILPWLKKWLKEKQILPGLKKKFKK
ncbi:MAG TPA: hypothetical protein VN704_06200 [Verrucomicrobiae bacterium]|nr:hypothetical protein [Verrucomicrobiae bacterium]